MNEWWFIFLAAVAAAIGSSLGQLTVSRLRARCEKEATRRVIEAVERRREEDLRELHEAHQQWAQQIRDGKDPGELELPNFLKRQAE